MDTSRLLPLFARLTAALILGGLVGYQRERRRHPAGLRTHMLVALGSALLTIISESYHGPGMDPSRITAQIVSGIGFLGAGTIIRHGASVRGLTTAASLWTVSAIGIGSGRGGTILWLTVFATLLTLLTLTVVDVFEDRYLGETRRRNLTVICSPNAFPLLLTALTDAHVAITSVVHSTPDVTGTRQSFLHVILPRAGVPEAILRSVQNVEGVQHARWDDRTETNTYA